LVMAGEVSVGIGVVPEGASVGIGITSDRLASISAAGVGLDSFAVQPGINNIRMKSITISTLL